jgi:hypothetical protein
MKGLRYYSMEYAWFYLLQGHVFSCEQFAVNLEIDLPSFTLISICIIRITLFKNVIAFVSLFSYVVLV